MSYSLSLKKYFRPLNIIEKENWKRTLFLGYTDRTNHQFTHKRRPVLTLVDVWMFLLVSTIDSPVLIQFFAVPILQEFKNGTE